MNFSWTLLSFFVFVWLLIVWNLVLSLKLLVQFNSNNTNAWLFRSKVIGPFDLCTKKINYYFNTPTKFPDCLCKKKKNILFFSFSFFIHMKLIVVGQQIQEIRFFFFFFNAFSFNFTCSDQIFIFLCLWYS